MATKTTGQSPSAIAKRRRRAERHQRVHVRASGLELPPGSAIKLRAGKSLDDAGQGKRKPLEPAQHPESEKPLTNHQRRRAQHADPQIQLPARQSVFALVVRMVLDHARAITGFLDRLYYCWNILLGTR